MYIYATKTTSRPILFDKMEETNNLSPQENAPQQPLEQATAKTEISQEHSPYTASSELSSSFSGSRVDLSLINSKITHARKEIANYLVGQHEMVDLLLAISSA